MRQILPRLTFGVTLALAVIYVVGWRVDDAMALLQDTDPKPNDAPTPAVSADEGDDAASADESSDSGVALLTSVRDQLGKFETIQAEISETVSFGHRKFRAVGAYIQGSDGQLRITLRVAPKKEESVDKSSGEKETSDAEASDDSKDDNKRPASRKKGPKERPPAETIHVCDGQILYTQTTIGGRTQATRRDVRTILKELGGLDTYTSDSLTMDMGLGGLKSLVASIQDAMVFGDVIEREIEGVSFRVIQGKWRPDLRAKMAGTEDLAVPMPGYMPDFVRVYIDENDFPRRVLYLKRHPTERKVRPLVTLDFTNVRLNGEVDPNQFVYVRPESVRTVQDITKPFIELLKSRVTGNAPAEDSNGGSANPAQTSPLRNP